MNLYKLIDDRDVSQVVQSCKSKLLLLFHWVEWAVVLGCFISVTHLSCCFCLQKLQEEVQNWQPKVDDFNKMADKMVEQFSSDDLSGLKDAVAKVNAGWTSLLAR